MRDTPMLLEGVPPDRITVRLLVDIMDVAEQHGIHVEGISILRDECGDSLFVDRGP